MESRERPIAMMRFDSIAWIRSPAFDLLVISNVLWPLLLLPGFSSTQDTAVDFWQLYFLTLPHRWMTMFLVAIDPDRRQSLQWQLLASALLLAALVWGVELGTGTLLCLGALDYIWNGWHFASQHAGVLRIYAKKTSDGNSGGGMAWLERWGVRGFITYVILRTAGMTLWGGIPQMQASHIGSWLEWLDVVMLGFPIALWMTNLRDVRVERLGKVIYLSSVMLLYSGYLLAFRSDEAPWILCFATAAAMFHAVEYLAIVSHYAMRRENHGSSGPMQWFAKQWVAVLIGFMLVTGALGWWLTHSGAAAASVWQTWNLWAALTHYTWDGWIWKLRRAETSQALGAT
jgi:hypothetical protein